MEERVVEERAVEEAMEHRIDRAGSTVSSPPGRGEPGRGRPIPRLRLAAALLTALAGATMARGEAPLPPPYYAIEGARVVTGAGPILESATVLLADGLIEAVGADLATPGDAWVIDGSGLTVYPGLIDGLSSRGQAPPEGAGPPGGGGGGGFGERGPEIRGPEDRPRTTPWVSAADLLGEDPQVDKWREAGFTAAVTVPESGIFAGQAVLIHLGDAEPRQRVIAGPLAQRLAFDTQSFRSYPGSLMGVLAYVRQVLLDTEHYARVESLYAADPRGRERPVYDPALAALAEALAARRPFLVPGDLGREIDRALALGAEHDLATVVYGARGAYGRAEQLAAAGAAALVSLDWPEAEPDRDPDADTPFRTLYHRRLAVTTPAVLAAAGVPFAFTSGGLSSPEQVFENVRLAVEAGLSPAAALAALTSAPAGIFGVADRVGTLEKGKIANLVVATDDPWAEGAEIRMVFVDGRKYEERVSDEPVEPPAADVSGTWTLEVESPRGSRELTARLTMAPDGKVTGEVSSESGESSVDEGRMAGDLLRFKVTRMMGERSVEASYSLTVEGESASGSLSAGPMTMDVRGERTAPAEAGEEAAAKAAETVRLEELAAAMAVYQGPAARLGSFAIVNARVYTVSGETIDGGTVLVRDGKIRAVGRDVAVPAGVETIDAAGGSLIPGIVDAHSHTAAEGGVNEGSLAVTSMVGIEDVLDPDDVAIYRALAGGVTSANILHGSANPIGGQNAIIKMRWGADAAGLELAGAPPGIKFALGENPKRSNFRRPGMPERYPQTRMGVMDVIREALTEARAYQEEWDAYRAGSGGKGALPPRRDLELEALAEVLSGERQVHAHCYRADEILQLLRLAEEFSFRVATLQHVLEGYKVADEIAAHGAGASTFSDWWGYKVEAYDAIPYNAALMAERGVVVSINSDSDEEMRHLNQEAAKAMKWGGLDEVAALKLVTLNPAIQLGIADRVGSIEVGKDADLVLYDGPPLAVESVVSKTFVDGDLYFDREADRRRQETIDAIKARLLGGAAEEEGGGEAPDQVPDGVPDEVPDEVPNEDPDAAPAGAPDVQDEAPDERPGAEPEAGRGTADGEAG